MQYLKAKTGKVIHWQEQGAGATAGVCICGKAGLLRVELGKVEHMISEGKGSYCLAAEQAAEDFMGPIAQAAKDVEEAIKENAEQRAYREPEPGILAALMDQYNARMEKVNKRRAMRKLLRDQERARALGLESGDMVLSFIPNRTDSRAKRDTGISPNGRRVFGRIAARRKARSSYATHRAVMVGNITLRVAVGQPVQSGVPMRAIDRSRIGVQVAGR